MSTRKKTAIFCIVVACAMMLAGCGKEADETKPLSEVKTEAETMDVAKLKAMALKYKAAIEAKTGDIGQVADKLKKIPLTEALGTEAKELKSEIDALTKSLNDLKERFDVYYQKLKDKGEEVSDLKI